METRTLDDRLGIRRPIDSHAQRLKSGHRREAIFPGEKAGDPHDAFRNAAQHDGPMRDRLVAWHSQRRIMQRCGFDEKVHGRVLRRSAHRFRVGAENLEQ